MLFAMCCVAWPAHGLEGIPRPVSCRTAGLPHPTLFMVCFCVHKQRFYLLARKRLRPKRLYWRSICAKQRGSNTRGWWYSASVPVHCKPCARTFERDGLQRSGVRVLIKVCCSAQVHSGRLELRERCLELLYTRVAQQLDLAGAEGDSRVRSSNREHAVAGEPRPGRCALLGAGSTRQDQ